MNLSVAKAAVREYHDSGDYLREVERVADSARVWIAERAAARREGERLAVVFDVDETVLSNYPQMDHQDFGYTRSEWLEWIAQAAAPALPPVKAVYDTALEAGVAVIFLTGRHDPEERDGTIANLRDQGLGDYTRLIMQTDGEADSAAARKTARRAALVAEGFTIVASLGDQESDLVGGFAERTFKLPNPFYLIP